MKGLLDDRVNRRSGNWGHLLLYLPRLLNRRLSLAATIIPAIDSGCAALADRSSENVPVVEGCKTMPFFYLSELLQKRETPHDGQWCIVTKGGL